MSYVLYSDLSMALNGEIDCKLILFMSLFVCLLVLVEASYLQLFSFILGKRTGNTRILESSSKENFKTQVVHGYKTLRKRNVFAEE